MSSSSRPFLRAVEQWLKVEKAIQSAVLFGSNARAGSREAGADPWSDVDLHVVTTDADRLEKIDWAGVFPTASFRLQVVRPATGGVKKATLLFARGQIDLVIVPAAQMRWARREMKRGTHERDAALRTGLNEIKTCLRSGYRFLKGERQWGAFYARIDATMPGVRIDDGEVRNFAEIFLCDVLWVVQKLRRGELIAAQHLLHRSLVETNLRLARELRLRRGEPVPSFGLGRRAERLWSRAELGRIRVSARLDRRALETAAWHALDGMQELVAQLVPAWRIPSGMGALFAEHRRAGRAAVSSAR